MPLTKITCPHCKKVLKPPKPVPEGAKLKCPGCQKGFVAGADDDGIVETLDVPAPSQKKAADEIDVIDILQDDEPAPKKEKVPAKKQSAPEKKADKKPDKKPDPAPAVDDEAGTYGLADKDEHKEEETPRGKKGKKKAKEEMSFAPDLAPKDPRGPAQEQVIICSNYMLLSAIVGFVGYVVLIIVLLIPAVTPITSDVGTKEKEEDILFIDGGLGGAYADQTFNPEGNQGPPGLTKDDKEKPSIFTVFGIDMAGFSSQGLLRFLLILLPLVLGMVYAAIIAYGAVTTQSMESRAWGIAASILTMIPYHILGLVVFLCWGIEILMVGVLDSDIESVRYMEIGIVAMFVIAEVLVGVWVLTVLLKEDVREGFEFKPE